MITDFLSGKTSPLQICKVYKHKLQPHIAVWLIYFGTGAVNFLFTTDSLTHHGSHQAAHSACPEQVKFKGRLNQWLLVCNYKTRPFLFLPCLHICTAPATLSNLEVLSRRQMTQRCRPTFSSLSVLDLNKWCSLKWCPRQTANVDLDQAQHPTV